jgi:hypothetical protein
LARPPLQCAACRSLPDARQPGASWDERQGRTARRSVDGEAPVVATNFVRWRPRIQT